MKFLISLLAIVTVFLASGVQSQDDGDEMSSAMGQVYCGRKLARTLAVICRHGMLLKRGGSYNSIMRAEPDYGWPWIAHHKARSLERTKRQAASECCEKPCTLDELYSYCRQ